jgi:hypothetical protein
MPDDGHSEVNICHVIARRSNSPQRSVHVSLLSGPLTQEVKSAFTKFITLIANRGSQR